jgi:murein DD-endopeptidase MepM/ murein hydrolase activator NlpD
MNDKRTILQRFGGYAIVVIAAVLLIINWQTDKASGGAETVNLNLTESESIAATRQPVSIDEDEDRIVLGELPVLTDDGLSPNADPSTYQGQLPQHEFQTYVVERGDTPNGIADRFGIKAETILGGNPKLSEESSLLQTGVELIILPIDGVLHDVKIGDTLEGLSQHYGIPAEDIIAYEPNRLAFPYRLYPDSQILVPGAVRELFVWTPPTLSSVGGTSNEGSGVKPIIVGTGTFIFPVSSSNFTQYFWYGHPGVDIGLPEGNAVFASDTGTVTFAGWNVYGYGNLIVVNHGNGYETFYGHLSGINVVPGQIVYQGNVIGATGNTGNSSGPHVHFEIRINNNRDNPCWYIGC